MSGSEFNEEAGVLDTNCEGPATGLVEDVDIVNVTLNTSCNETHGYNTRLVCTRSSI